MFPCTVKPAWENTSKERPLHLIFPRATFLLFLYTIVYFVNWLLYFIFKNPSRSLKKILKKWLFSTTLTLASHWSLQAYSWAAAVCRSQPPWPAHSPGHHSGAKIRLAECRSVRLSLASHRLSTALGPGYLVNSWMEETIT